MTRSFSFKKQAKHVIQDTKRRIKLERRHLSKAVRFDWPEEEEKHRENIENLQAELARWNKFTEEGAF